jgi:acetyl-CoA C-acetyltransferase
MLGFFVLIRYSTILFCSRYKFQEVFMYERVAIVGVGWAGFRSTTPEISYKELMYEAAIRAYADAGVDPRADVESFVTVAEDFHEGTSIFDEYVPDQIGGVLKPVHTITGDGLHGLAAATMLIRTGLFDIVAVEGHSKASNILTLPEITAHAQDPVLNRPLRLNTEFVAGLEMNRYMHDVGTTSEQCAAVVVKNRFNALNNPSAAYGADIDINDVLYGPPLTWPLGRRETSQHADGSIVMVLASDKVARSLSDMPVWIIGIGWTNGAASLESRDWSSAPYLNKAARMAYQQAGIGSPILEIDFAEVDDTYAYKELQSLEAIGIFLPGEAGDRVLDGYTTPEGEFPVNVSGGSLGCGHLLEATGLARALEVVLQLRGQAGSRQLEDVEIGLAQSWRGVPTTSGAVAILSN